MHFNTTLSYPAKTFNLKIFLKQSQLGPTKKNTPENEY